MSYNACGELNGDGGAPNKIRMLDGAELAEAAAQAVLAQLADIKRMLEDMREQRDKWKALAERRLAVRPGHTGNKTYLRHG